MKFIKLALLTLVISTPVCAQTNQPTPEQIDIMMIRTVEKMNKELPKQADSITTLLILGYENKTLSYSYRIDDVAVFKSDETQTIITDKTCSNSQTSKLINEYSFSYHYNYVDKDNKQLTDFTINKATCNK